jgi:hypothetical protein
MLLRLSAPVRDLYKPYRLTRDAPSSSMAQVCPATRAVDGLSERDRRGRIPLRDRVWLTLALWPRRAVRLAQWLPGELEDVDEDLGAPALRRPAHLAFDGADGRVQPAVSLVVGEVGHAAHELAQPPVDRAEVPVPREQDGGAVIGFQRPAEVGDKRANARIIRGAPGPRYPAFAAPLGEQEVLALRAPRSRSASRSIAQTG